MYQSLSQRSLFGRFLSNAGIYGASLLLTRAGWIVLLPLYWRELTPEDYGVIGIAQVVQVVLGPVLSLGLHDAVQRYYHEWSAAERPRHIGAIWLLAAGWSLVVCLALDAAGAWLAPHIFVQVPFDPYLRLALWTAFLTNISVFPLAIVRAREEVRLFSALTVTAFVLQGALGLWLVLGVKMGAAGFLLASLASALVMSAEYARLMARHAKLDGTRAHLAEPLRYGVPTMPGAILDGTASLFDRYFLDKHESLSRIGLYNLGNQFGGAFSVFNQMLKASWLPFLYRLVAERRDAPDIVARFGVYYIALLAPPALGVALLSRELLLAFGDARFIEVYAFIPVFVLVYYIQAAGAAMGRGMDLAKKTGWSPVISLVSIAVSVTALAILVPRWKAEGALAALVIGALVRAVFQIAISVRLYPRPLHLARLCALWGVVVAAFFAGHLAAPENAWLAASFKLVVIALAALAVARIALGRELFDRLWRRCFARAERPA